MEKNNIENTEGDTSLKNVSENNYASADIGSNTRKNSYTPQGAFGEDDADQVDIQSKNKRRIFG